MIIEGKSGKIRTSGGDEIRVNRWSIELVKATLSSWSGLAICDYVGFIDLGLATIIFVDDTGSVWLGSVNIRKEDTRSNDVHLEFEGTGPLYRDGTIA